MISSPPRRSSCYAKCPRLRLFLFNVTLNTPFAAGSVVFPGGRIEESDNTDDWTAAFPELNKIPGNELGPRIAALREAFEETGMLLAYDEDGTLLQNNSSPALSEARQHVDDDPGTFISVFRSLNLRPAIDKLTLFARWQPPAFVTHRRYLTWFYVAIAPAGQTALEDGIEATETMWTSPVNLLAEEQAGNRKLMLPTILNLELLGCFQSAKAIIENAKSRPIETIEPGRTEGEEGMYFTIPEHLGYPRSRALIQNDND